MSWLNFIFCFIAGLAMGSCAASCCFSLRMIALTLQLIYEWLPKEVTIVRAPPRRFPGDEWKDGIVGDDDEAA